MPNPLYQKERDDRLTRELGRLKAFRRIAPELRTNDRNRLAEIRALQAICLDFKQRYGKLRREYRNSSIEDKATALIGADRPEATLQRQELECIRRSVTEDGGKIALFGIFLWLEAAISETEKKWPPYRLPANHVLSPKSMEQRALRQLVALAAKHGLTREQLEYELDRATGILEINLGEKARRGLINHFGKKVRQK